MMSMEDDITEELKNAMRAGDKKRVAVLRMLLSELKVARASGEEFEEMDVIQSYAKKLRKSAEEYEELEKAEKADEVRGELQIVEEFLPEQMDRGEIEEIVEQIIEENDYGPRDIGRVMKTIMGEYGEKVDGRVVNEVARSKLAERD
jgi:hypothetical protein